MYRNKTDSQKIACALGYHFKNRKLLLQALTRRSGLNEGRQKSHIGDFQRLEFIGDKVLNLIVSDILLENHPTWDEGQLTQKASEFVNNKGPLAKMAEKLKLGDYLIVGRCEEKTRTNKKVLSDAFEALIGALWLDSDKDFKFIRKFLLNQLKVLGLSDFNEDYAQAVIERGGRKIVSDLMESILPEIYEAQGGGEVSIGELFKFESVKKRATKPLTGLAAAFERFALPSASDTEESDEAEHERDVEEEATGSPTKPARVSVPELKAPGKPGYFATASPTTSLPISSSSSKQTLEHDPSTPLTASPTKTYTRKILSFS